jgi:hypothetical protein
MWIQRVQSEPRAQASDCQKWINSEKWWQARISAPSTYCFPEVASRKLRACHHFSSVENFYHGLLHSSRPEADRPSVGGSQAADTELPEIR